LYYSYKDKFIKIALIVAIILLSVLVYISFINKVDKKPTYHAVYLQTGDMYFGKLSRFPKLTLSDVWFLQVSTQEDQKAGFNLVKFTNTVFGPKDKMEINKENVVWISKLRDDSQVVSFILQSKTPALQNSQPQVAPPTTLPTLKE